MTTKRFFLFGVFIFCLFVAGWVRADDRKLVKSAQPVYPPIAAKMKIEGSVKLDATIDADGTVSDVKVVSGHTLLVPAAVEAVKKWKYEPAAAKSTQIVTVDFALNH